MKSRKLGNTRYRISEMGFGCGGFWGYRQFDENTAISLIHRAMDGGVNFFDTGASYSGGNAEVRLGKALRQKNVDGLIIGTKVGTAITPSGLKKDFSRATIFSQVENSLKNLGLETIPLLQLHSPSIADLNDDTFATLEVLKKQGKIQIAGASCDGDVLVAAIGSGALDVVMMTYNLIEKGAKANLELAHSHDLGVLIKSPLCHTLYSNDIFRIRKLSDVWYFLRVLKNYRPMLFEGRKYRFICDIQEWSSHEIALLYALDDMVSCVVTGTTNPANMSGNLAAMTRSLPRELRERIDAV